MILVEAARWVLVVTFGVAAVGKLTRRGAVPGVAYLLRQELRIPAAMPVAWALVLAETMVTGLLVVPATVVAGVTAAVVLSAALTAGLAILVFGSDRGATAACHCFGSAAVPTGWTVARNSALTTLSVVGLLAWLSAEEAGASPRVSWWPGLAGLAVVAAWWVARRDRTGRDAVRDGHRSPASTRHPDPVTLPASGLEPGEPAPPLPGLGPRALVAVLSAGCRGCRAGLPRLVEYARAIGGRDHVVVAVVGDPAVAGDILAALHPVAIMLTGPEADRIAADHRVRLFPSYALVAGGRVRATGQSLGELPAPAVLR